jgi:hypothetical protein
LHVLALETDLQVSSASVLAVSAILVVVDASDEKEMTDITFRAWQAIIQKIKWQ